jgi:hypothetical protein
MFIWLGFQQFTRFYMALRVEPFVKASSFPNSVKMEPDGIGRGDNGTGDDVVSIHEGASDWLANPVDVDRRSSDEGYHEANRSGEEARHHECAKMPDV